jgi:hypothetical protein
MFFYILIALKGLFFLLFGIVDRKMILLLGLTPSIFMQFFYSFILLILYFFAILNILRNKKNIMLQLSACFFILVAILSSGAESYSRFRIPIEPLLFVVSGVDCNNFFIRK